MCSDEALKRITTKCPITTLPNLNPHKFTKYIIIIKSLM